MGANYPCGNGDVLSATYLCCIGNIVITSALVEDPGNPGYDQSSMKFLGLLIMSWAFEPGGAHPSPG